VRAGCGVSPIPFQNIPACGASVLGRFLMRIIIILWLWGIITNPVIKKAKLSQAIEGTGRKAVRESCFATHGLLLTDFLVFPDKVSTRLL